MSMVLFKHNDMYAFAKLEGKERAFTNTLKFIPVELNMKALGA